MSDPLHQLAADLRVVIGQLVRRVREDTMLDGLSLPQLQLLGYLERDGAATLTTLARAAGVRTQSLGETVAEMKAQGFVAGTADPADGRQTLLSLTPEGVARIKASRALREDWLARTIEARLSPEEQVQLGTAVTLLSRLLP